MDKVLTVAGANMPTALLTRAVQLKFNSTRKRLTFESTIDTDDNALPMMCLAITPTWVRSDQSTSKCGAEDTMWDFMLANAPELMGVDPFEPAVFHLPPRVQGLLLQQQRQQTGLGRSDPQGWFYHRQLVQHARPI